MSSILREIVERRKVALREQSLPEPVERTVNSKTFVEQLAQGCPTPAGLILECKKASPSKGVMVENYQPEAIAKVYEPYASAISVLTEPDYFKGSLEHLRAVRDVVDQPLLCKDFIIDEKQIDAAKLTGANIILLMLSVLNGERYKKLKDYAESKGLETITEVIDEQEVERAVSGGAKIIGINNRNLHTLETDLINTEKLAPLIPDDRLIIAESGIYTRSDLLRLAPHVDGFLIGSSMMQSSSLKMAVRKLLFGDFKICGLTNAEDLQKVSELGAAYAGIILTDKSKRYVSLDDAESWTHEAKIPLVGVFMNQTIEFIVEASERLKLSVIQLHGDESQEFINNLSEQIPDCRIWKALTVNPQTAQSESAVADAVNEQRAKFDETTIERFLIDTPKTSSSNNQLNLNGLLSDSKLLLAGARSIDDSIYQNPKLQAGIDLCSAVECQPGQKDPNLLSQLFANLIPKTRKHHDRK